MGVAVDPRACTAVTPRPPVEQATPRQQRRRAPAPHGVAAVRGGAPVVVDGLRRGGHQLAEANQVGWVGLASVAAVDPVEWASARLGCRCPQAPSGPPSRARSRCGGRSTSTAIAIDATAITIALRTPTLRNSCWPRRTGTRTATMSSHRATSALRFGPVKNSCDRASRRPPARPARRRHPAPTSTGSVSPAGDAVPRLPPIVPALRICGEPTVRAA